MFIELAKVSKEFANKKLVLNEFTYSGDIKSLAIIGPSGGGKSTLLRIIGGLIYPTSGEVKIDGAPVVFEEKHLLDYRRTIGFVFQSKSLFSHLTGLENIVMPLVNVHKYTRTNAEELSIHLLERFGLEEDGHKYPYELSGGQQQRIAIARAIAVKPKLLLLDEPTSALDPELTGGVLDMVKELQDEGLHVILVTHEMGFAKNACEKVMFLADGKLIEQGNSMEMFTNPKSQELQAFLNRVLEWHV